MIKLTSLFKYYLFFLAVPLVAQVSPFVESPAFGGTSLFADGMIPIGDTPQARSGKDMLAFGYATGEQGADSFMSLLDDFSSGNLDKLNAAILGFADSPWGLRSRAYGLLMLAKNGSSLTPRQEMTSLWAKSQDNQSVGFDTRRSVVDRLAFTYITQGKRYLGSTLRIERWSFGNAYRELGAFTPDAALSQARDLLDYDRIQKRNNITYALDAFVGIELPEGIRLAIHADRLTTKRLGRFGDVEEKPQYRAGAQIDIGALFELTVESDINKAMRMPFPVEQKTMAASLKVKANTLITFAIGIERKTMDSQHTTRTGLNVWITGKKHRVGVGLQLGQNRAPWGATWKIQ